MRKQEYKVSIVVPTYNERDNVKNLCHGIDNSLTPGWDYEIIIVDDGSPDGTGLVVKELCQADSRIKLIERPCKLGLGSAVVAGFNIAVGDYLVMMDADMSHRPEDLPNLLDTLSDCDIVVGSRYIPSGQVKNWPVWRRVVSIGASAIGRLIVGLDVRDLTSGFGAFKRDHLIGLLPSLSPKGFKLLLEILGKSRGATIKECPITFEDRKFGKSKASALEFLQFLKLCFRLRRLAR